MSVSQEADVARCLKQKQSNTRAKYLIIFFEPHMQGITVAELDNKSLGNVRASLHTY